MSTKQPCTHSSLPGYMCVVLPRWGSITKKMSIHISGSDATWSRPPPACPEGRTGNCFVCWFTIMKMRTKGGGTERRKNAAERSRVNAPHRVVFYLSSVLLWHDPKKPAQIPADYICLSSSTNLSSLWLKQTTASTPPLFTPRLQVWPDFGWLKNFWLSMFHKGKKKKNDQKPLTACFHSDGPQNTGEHLKRKAGQRKKQ